jgi:hypothetical protein
MCIVFFCILKLVDSLFGVNMARLDVIADLRERISRIERSERLSTASGLSTGIAGLDRLLPGGGLAGGTLVEWLAEGEASGAASLALAVAAKVVQQGGAFVVLDGRREFYPPAAAQLGIPLERTVVVQPPSTRAELWALELALRSRAVAVALGWLGNVNDRVCRRLQLAAEAGGSIGFLLRPAACRGAPSWAELRLLVEALPLTRHSSLVTRHLLDGPLANGFNGRSAPLANGSNGRRKAGQSSRVSRHLLAGGPIANGSNGLPPPLANGDNGGEGVPLLTRSVSEGGGKESGAVQSLGRRLRVELLHCRGGVGGGAVVLEVGDEAGAVRVAAQLADPAPVRRAAGA